MIHFYSVLPIEMMIFHSHVRLLEGIRLGQFWISTPITWDTGTPNIPFGKHTKIYGKSPCLMGKSTISMVRFQ